MGGTLAGDIVLADLKKKLFAIYQYIYTETKALNIS